MGFLVAPTKSLFICTS